jgi:hypothetical protein
MPRPAYRIPLHTIHPPTDYAGTLTETGARHLGVPAGRYVYETRRTACADVFDGAECVGRNVDLGPDGILPDNPPTRLE